MLSAAVEILNVQFVTNCFCLLKMQLLRRRGLRGGRFFLYFGALQKITTTLKGISISQARIYFPSVRYVKRACTL